MAAKEPRRRGAGTKIAKIGGDSPLRHGGTEGKENWNPKVRREGSFNSRAGGGGAEEKEIGDSGPCPPR